MIGVGAQVALLAACGQAPQAPPASTASAPTAAAGVPAGAGPTPPPAAVVSSPTALPAGQPRSGGTLRMGEPVEMALLDGHVNQGQGSYDTLWQVFDKLTVYDDKLVPQSRLAESWDFSSDQKTLKLNLRKGVQFHNGKELTSDDVKWNMLRVRDPKVAVAQLAAQSSWWTEIETPDKYTVVLKSEQARPSVFDFFEYFNILDRGTVEGPNAATTVVGTGPFTFGEWAQGNHLELVKNKNYWNPNRPYLDAVRVQFVKDLPALTSQFEADSLDIVMTPALTDFTRLQKDTKYGTLVNPISGTVSVLNLNLTVPPLDQKAVRQALNYAMNRQRFVDVARLGIGNAQDLPWSPSSPAFEPAKNTHYTFDLDRAKSLLAVAGVSGLTLDFVYFTGNPSGGLAQIYQADLAAIGVRLNIVQTELAVWRELANTRKYNGISGGASTYANLEPVSMLGSSTAWNYTGNSSGYTSETYTRLVTSAASEPDTARRKQLYSQLNDLILDESFVMPISPTPTFTAFNGRVRGVGYSAHEAVNLANVWLES
jgi:peptide/nickel transport system substrate-binding protein